MAGVEPCLCLDASVGAKWFLRDEVNRRDADALLELFALGHMQIVVPDLFFYEMGNLLSSAVRRARLPYEAGLRYLQDVKRLNLDVVPVRGYMEPVLSYCSRFRLSFYDSTYLATAEGRGVPFVTADQRLLKAVSPQLDWVLDPARAVALMSAGPEQPRT